MVEIRHLKNAPITEALIDFRVKNSNADSLEKSLDILKKQIGAKYPQAKAAQGFSAEVQFRAGGVAEQRAGDTGFQGYLFISEDEKNIVQFRADGFTFNRLKPYTDWESIYTEAISLWKLYIEAAKPEYVIRVALRYINQIRLTLPIDDLSKYFTIVPSAPEDTFYHFKSFLSRILVFEPKMNLEGAITHALEPNIEPNSVIIFLDIEAFKQKEFSPQSDDIPATLTLLRKMKNDIFFGSITEDTARLFNGS